MIVVKRSSLFKQTLMFACKGKGEAIMLRCGDKFIPVCQGGQLTGEPCHFEGESEQDLREFVEGWYHDRLRHVFD